MKRISGIIASALLLLLAAGQGYAQRYQPRDTWPYLNEEFVEGNVRVSGGDLLEGRLLNVCIADGRLHYVEDGSIMAADMNNVFTASIGGFVYVNRGGKMFKVLVETDGGAVLQFTEVDFEEMNKTDIGYGISSSTASSQHTTLSGLGLTDEMGGFGIAGNSRYEAVRDNKGSGKVIPQKESLWLLVGGSMIPATRKDFLSYPGIDKDAAAKFLKENKIKWNKPLSLAKVVEYLTK